MIPTYITVILTVLVIFIIVAILYGIKSDLEDAELYKAEVDKQED
jgi:biopolymer transport protein ExbD